MIARMAEVAAEKEKSETILRRKPGRIRARPWHRSGLSIAQEIVRAYGGRITLESQVGGGSTFTVGLPSAE